MAENFAKIPSIYPKLLEIRKSKTAELKSNKFLKESTKLRYYQVIGSLHMMLLTRMVLADAAGLGKCVSEDTYIPTSKGLIKIGSLINKNMEEDGFYPIPPDLHILSDFGLNSPSRFFYCGKKDGLMIRTSKGFSITGLGHHPILKAGEKSAEFEQLFSLLIGDYVCIHRKGLFSDNYISLNSPKDLKINSKMYNNPPYLNEDLAELIGYYVSEGCSSLNHIRISQHDEEINARIRFLIEKCFSYKENTNVKEFYKVIKINSSFIYQFLTELGLDLESHSDSKSIPGIILESPKSVQVSFLKGYFEGDGGIWGGTDGISCVSKSEELIKQIQLILLNLGIISKKWPVFNKKYGMTYWALYFFGKNIDLFKKEVNFESIRKKNELDTTLKNRKDIFDTIPFGKTLLKESINNIRTCYPGKSVKKLFEKKLWGCLQSVLYNNVKLSYNTLKRFIMDIEKNSLQDIIKNYNVLMDIVEKNYFFDKIVEIKEVKDKIFVDLEVPLGHNFTGNGFINHNTCETIAAYSFLLEKEPNLKLLVICPKSAVYQWQEEFEKFSQGITTRVLENKYQGKEGFAARSLQYKAFTENVLITNYNPLLEEYEYIKNILLPSYMMVIDEVHTIKNRKAKINFSCKEVAMSASRVYGLSATVIKNSLEEVYGVYSVVVPGLFGNITSFLKQYTHTKLMKLRIGGKDRYIPQLDTTKGLCGYKSLDQFKQLIDPYILARKKEDVASELPKLISRKVILKMEPAQKELYKKALNGILYEEKVKRDFYEVADSVRNGSNDAKTLSKYEELKKKYEMFLTDEGKKRGKLAALTYCQMICNGPSLVGEEGPSSKEIEFERLLVEELTEGKIIVFSRFKQGISNLEVICDRLHVGHTKISGDVTSSWDRDVAKRKFMEDPQCRVIFITLAGSASLNLQAAGTIIFYDTPWSYGDLVQTIGRAQRIGSIQEHVLLLHFANRGTIDMRVLNKVSGKKELSTEILGDTSKGALDFTGSEDVVVNDLFQDILEDAKGLDDDL